MSHLSGQSVVITGASSGIGEATAKLLAAKGAQVMLGARRQERLQDLAQAIEKDGGKATYQTVDVTQQDQVEALAQAALDAYGKIDIWINNAGLMPLSRLDKLRVEEWDKIVDVNIKGVLYGIAAALPPMQAANRGHIVNISSVAGHKVFPGGAVYCASKFAVRVISEGLRQEIGGNIRCTIISPGAVATELTDSVKDPDASKQMDQVYDVAIKPEAIAEAIAYAVEQPDEVDINEIMVRPTAQEL
ncbi:SDR family oxidoreductase [Almyronema epifaneia]|uniref:SDR family oxidoreductase n=1 Tax=Almyronema epifaneia S1 TaxID=2991925 RepID=A0ABW6ICK0_9CYAN